MKSASEAEMVGSTKGTLSWSSQGSWSSREVPEVNTGANHKQQVHMVDFVRRIVATKLELGGR